MSISRSAHPRQSRTSADRGALALGGALVLGGLVVNAVQRGILHPTGAEDDHAAIFAEYAASDAWVATHVAEFVLVLVALSGLLVICRAAWPRAPGLALLAAGALVAAGAVWAVLQAVDGVTLKQTVDSWAAATGSDKAVRFADAETVRWTEWGLQSYFRVLLGVAFLLLAAALVVSRTAPGWLAALLGVGGLLSVVIGLSVGYDGLESGLQDAVSWALQIVVLAFAVGLVVVGRRAPERDSQSLQPHLG